MNKESYRILKELNSLYDKLELHQKNIAAQNKRIITIQDMRTESQNEQDEAIGKLQSTKAELLKIENELALTHQKLEKDQDNLAQLISENEISSLTNQIEQNRAMRESFEQKAFDLMENIEEFEKTIEEKRNFLKGSSETILEIQEEVNGNIAVEQKEIDILANRIDLLKTDLSDDVLNRYLKIAVKKLTHGALAQIQNKHCSICKLTLSQVDIDAVEKNFKLKSCQGCERLFIPISSLY